MKKSITLFICTLLIIACSSEDDTPLNDCGSDVALDVYGISTNSARLSIFTVSDGSLDDFWVEYGLEGFAPGSGTVVQTQEYDLLIDNLSAGTTYSVYIKKRCVDGNYSSAIGPKKFTTLECKAIEDVNITSITETTARVNWFDETTASEIEFGPAGFSVGAGTKISIGKEMYWYDLEGLEPSTTYDLYMRNICGSDFSSYSHVTSFTTLDLCKKPERLRLISFGRYSLRITWDRGDNSAWVVEYGPKGFTLGNGRILQTSVSNPLIEEGINPGTTYEFYVRADCGPEGFSQNAGPLVVTTQP